MTPEERRLLDIIASQQATILALTAGHSPASATEKKRTAAAIRQENYRNRQHNKPSHSNAAVTVTDVTSNAWRDAMPTITEPSQVTPKASQNVTSNAFIGSNKEDLKERESMEKPFKGFSNTLSLNSETVTNSITSNAITDRHTVTLGGRSTQWVHWDEAPTMRGKMRDGEGGLVQTTLDNVLAALEGDCENPAYLALVSYLVTSKHPATIASLLMGYATDGRAWIQLAMLIDSAYRARSTISAYMTQAFARMDQEQARAAEAYEPPLRVPAPDTRTMTADDARVLAVNSGFDWKKMKAESDAEQRADTASTARQWRSSDAPLIAPTR